MVPYREVLIAVSGGKDDETVLGLGASLAKRHDALARVVITTPSAIAELGGWGMMAGVYVGPEALLELQKLDAETRSRVRAQAIAAAKAAGLRVETKSGGGRMMISEHALAPWLALTQALPLADLAIVGGEQAKGAALAEGPLSEILMAARSPVLIARAATLEPQGTAAIAWDGSLQAGRAVRAAMPLLMEAKSVVILQDPAGLDFSEYGAAEPGLLAQYLQLHGIESVETMLVAGGAQGPSLVAAARSRGASLLVAGAYGHSRLKEWILGGATRAMLDAAGGPHLLLCH